MQNATGNATASRADALRLAELLTARLTHDLAGPLGTIAAALALFDEDAEEARTLAGAAAAAAVQRLKLLRAAWGPPAPLSGREISRLAAAVTRPNITVTLDLDPEQVVAAPLARMVVNLLLLAAESLPRGGAISLGRVAPGDFLVAITGPRAAWPAQFGLYLVDPDHAWAAVQAVSDGHPSGYQAPLAALLARAADLRLSLLFGRTDADPAPLLLGMRE